MDVDGQRLVAYVYQLVDGEVKVDKIEYIKSAVPREGGEKT
jgi:vacuolar protein sorting-associated protein 29